MSRHLAVTLSLLVFSLANGTLAEQIAGQQPRPIRDVPSPRAVLGFTPGDDRTVADWKQITNYFARLDRASERVLVQTLGETTQKRPLIVAAISAPENIRQLAKYKDLARRLADPRLISGDAERERILREARSVIVISCSIHSTEIVASQMSMQLAYELATAADAETREILAQTILLLVPSANPDGVDIVSAWYRRTLGTAHEGTEPPELYHHYAGHDNNRDWFMLNLRETKLLSRLMWKEWFPQIVYDVHQQGATGSRFFVPPFYDPPNPRIPPLLLREVGLLGHKIAADVQATGRQGVITNALYDTWWHGGFRTAPYYHNSIGILTEAASARLMSPTTVTAKQLSATSVRGMPSALQTSTNFPEPWPGGTWRPRDILEIEMSATRSVLSMAAKYRERYLRNFHQLGRRAIDDQGELLGFVVPAGQAGREEATAKMLGALIDQGVEVHRVDRELNAELNDSKQKIAAGSYVIFLAQPYRANVLSLFERQRYPERRTADGNAERPYDVAGWTLPLQMGVAARELKKIEESSGERRLTLLRDAAQVRRDLKLDADESPRPALANSPGRRIALYRGWTNSMDEGWTRLVFDTFRVPYRTLRDADVRGGNLRAQYDVIVLPSQREREIVAGRAEGSYPAEYTGGVTERGVQALRDFVKEGGTLVCFDQATELAIKSFDLPVRDALEGVGAAKFYCPGSILRLAVDEKHQLSKNIGAETSAYFANSRAFEVAESDDVRVVARYAERDLLQSGWLLGEQYLAGKAALLDVKVGRGRVVLFGFRPQHRGQTWATYPFIFNALG